MSKGTPYVEHEDNVIIRATNAGHRPAAIGALLNRSVPSIKQRIYALRRSKRLTGYVPASVYDETPLPCVPLRLNGDDRLVNSCLAEGGFPRAFLTSHGTVWGGPDGKLWKHTPPQNLRAVQSLRRVA